MIFKYSIFLFTNIFLLTFPLLGEAAKEIHISELYKPQKNLQLKVKSCENGSIEAVDGKWHIKGKTPLKVSFIPTNGTKWNISEYRLVGIPVLNQDSGLATLDGRLNNTGLTGWSHHAVGFSIAPSNEKTTLGFPFPVVPDRYQGPEIYKDQYGKPNGHRIHWRQFYPDDVCEITIEIKSSNNKIDLILGHPFLAWPASESVDKILHTLPFLDEFGQVRAVDWPGKAKGIEDIRQNLNLENQLVAQQAKSRKLNQYGGWIDGPRLESTGRFRTQKVNGKWWLVDPEGYLFFSVGVCMAGHNNETPFTKERIENNFFSWYPNDNHYLRWVGRKKQGEREFIHFPPLNFQRALGKNWESINRDGIHNRMRAWGLNTLGAWSDKGLQQDSRTPYTLVASIWWKRGYGTLPSPFRFDFEADLRKDLKSYLWAKDDPYCLGVFLGNELGWTNNFSNKLFELSDHPHDMITRNWFLAKLKEKYPNLKDLNHAWKTNYKAWDTLFKNKPKTMNQSLRNDIDSFFHEFASTFFAKCKQAINDVLPGTLYLGCRVNQAPYELGRAAAGHVDAYSINIYDSEVRTWHIPDDVDIPILVGEFHYGATDRGVPSPGLSSSWDQRQRGLAFAHYLASALADSRFVGVQWFQWFDQSAAGRWDKENHQIGFVDITGRAHTEFVKTVSKVTENLYSIRHKYSLTKEQVLERLLK